MEFSLLLIFWYGILHAFGPDHLVAIANFSLGKERVKTLLVTMLFALGHGASLFLFAKLLSYMPLSSEFLAWGDLISASVIIAIGLYLLYMALNDRIQLRKHEHEGQTHIHIWFGKSHTHDEMAVKASSFTLGALMGAGGVRGVLVTLAAVGSSKVDFGMIGAFTAGVMVVFIGFGLVIMFINEHLLRSQRNIRRAFALAGVASVAIGSHILLG